MNKKYRITRTEQIIKVSEAIVEAEGIDQAYDVGYELDESEFTLLRNKGIDGDLEVEEINE
jgi:hypothetical protein